MKFYKKNEPEFLDKSKLSYSISLYNLVVWVNKLFINSRNVSVREIRNPSFTLFSVLKEKYFEDKINPWYVCLIQPPFFIDLRHLLLFYPFLLNFLLKYSVLLQSST